MRFFYVINIGDKHTDLFSCWRPSNRSVCTVVGLFQIVIVLLSLSQHVYSVIAHNHIFLCQSNVTLASATFGELIMAWDIIIYDFGLFNYLLGTSECIANYLDGGYGRCMWCCGHVLTLGVMYIVLLSERNQNRPWMLVPVLLHQSIYSLGLMILILATIPKMVVAIGYSATMELFELLVWYIAGSIGTWFFTSVLWHYYWYLDDQIELRHKMEKEELAKSKMEIIKDGYPLNTVNTNGNPRIVSTAVDRMRDLDCDENENETTETSPNLEEQRQDLDPELDYEVDEVLVDNESYQLPHTFNGHVEAVDHTEENDVIYTTVDDILPQATTSAYDNQLYGTVQNTNVNYNYQPKNSTTSTNYSYSTPTNYHQRYSRTSADYNTNMNLYNSHVETPKYCAPTKATPRYIDPYRSTNPAQTYNYDPLAGSVSSRIKHGSNYRNPTMTQSYNDSYNYQPITYSGQQSTFYFPASEQVGVNYQPTTQYTNNSNYNYHYNPSTTAYAAQTCYRKTASNQSYYHQL